MFKIEKQEYGFDWKSFINKIRSYTYGCQSKEFQQALQENNIYFVAGDKFSQNRFDDYMNVEFNRKHFTILEHNNIGNY